MVPTDVLAPIGCHYHQDGKTWEITIFASLTEVVGGQRDGLRFPCHFVLDVAGVVALFSKVDSVEWQILPEGTEDEIGAHVAVEGTYQGEHVLLRIPAEAPERFEVGRFANVFEMRYVDNW